VTAPAGAPASHFATNGHAEEQRGKKARVLATWCWAHGLDGPALSGLDDAQRRHVARSADVNPPSTWATWAVVVGLLETAAERPDMAPRFGVDGTPDWARTTENDPAKNISSATPNGETRGAGGEGAGLDGSPEAGGIPALAAREGELTAYGERLGLEASIAAHPAGRKRGLFDAPLLPRGWQDLIDSGRTLGHGRTCSVSKCNAPAIAAAMTTYRCAGHPPMPGEWGSNLDWSPREAGTCAANRCHCGSCPPFRLAAVPSVPRPRDDKKGGRR